MGRTEWTGSDQAGLRRQHSGDRVDSRRLETFLKSHRRQNCWDTFREHRLACSWRPDEKHVVSAGHRDLDGAFCVKLSAYVAEVLGPTLRIDRRQLAFDSNWIYRTRT